MKKSAFAALLFVLLLSSITGNSQENKRDYKSYPYWIEMMEDPNANFFETQKAFNEYWDGREVTRGSGFKAFKRWEYWMGRKVSPDGTKPDPQRNIRAIEALHTSGMRSHMNANWTALGPFSVPSGYDGYRGLGRVNAIAFHPTDPNIIWAGAPSGGLWVTLDGGNTWATHTDGLPTLGVSSIVVNYSNPDIIYIGTGDRDHGDAAGAGVWKSANGGITFQPVNTGFTGSTVGKMIMHPSNPLILIAACDNGVFRTENGGVSWTNVIAGNFKDIVFKPGDPSIVYATASGNFYKSVNNGLSFTQITNGLTSSYRGSIAVTPANPEYVYFWTTNSDSFKGLYRSTNSGDSFSVRSTSPNIMSWDCNGGSGGQAWYDLDMAADPANAEIIYGGGVNCFKSTNGGTTWSINSHWWGDCGVPSVHADLHVLEYNPLNNRLYAGNDGGVYWTSNGGTSWNEISNGLIISQAYKLGQSATTSGLVINGYQDNGTSTWTGSDWVNVFGGDGMECAFDPTDESYSYNTLYYGSIYRNINNVNESQIAGEGANGIDESGGWVTPFVIDPFDGNTMFIGYDNIWRSTNIKAANSYSVSWTKISNLNVSDFDQLKQSDANTNILYASDGNNLYRSDNVKDASVIWNNLTGSLPSGNTITAIEVHPTDENIVYLVQQNSVYKSINKGGSWTDITNNLPSVQMHTLAYYHSSNEGLYLGTDIGVFYSDANNPQWVAYSTGLPAAAWITELEIYYDANPDNDRLRASTFGRGLWESPLMGTLAPGMAGPISGPTGVCHGQEQVTYSIEEIENATSYVWTLPEGATGTSSTTSITIDFSENAVSDFISVYGVNNYGSGAASSLFIDVLSLPGDAGAIAGPDTVCQGQMAVVYTVDDIVDATSYIWSLPPGATGSSTSNSITVDFGSNASTGMISVWGINECGTGSGSVLAVAVNELPVAAGTITGNETVCQGTFGVVYTTEVIAGASSYNWTLPEGASGFSNTNSINVDFTENATSGLITVNGSNECGPGEGSSFSVTINVKPETPQITANGHDLHSDAPNGNQWHDQNGIINGATEQDYVVTWDGDYYTIVTLNGCSSDTSNILRVIVTGAGYSKIEEYSGYRLYPNPVSHELVIERTDEDSNQTVDSNNSVDYFLYDHTGKVILNGALSVKTIVDVTRFSAGVYLMKIEDERGVHFFKIIRKD
ncbi:MAG TPA: T9SS type A sorting domain-containing protein [Lentimicrobium sp.]|nr:T9SS type A sorting domain-containing protein [Lentimicrobium sp.]